MKLLSHLKIRTKLTSMVCLAALTITAIIAVSAFLSKSRMMEDRVQQMKTAVDILYTLAQSVQDDVTAGKLTQAEAKAQFHMRGRRMTFNGNQGYPVVYNADTSILVNGANQQLEGKITGAKDSNGVLIADAIISAGNQTAQGGVTSYLYPRPGQTEPVRKTVFTRKFAPWNATISYGLYVDDIDADVRALTLELAGIGVGLMLLMATLSWLIARDVLSALDRQKTRMQEISEGAIDKPVEETGRGDEIGRMAETLEVLRQTALTARNLEAEQVATKTRSEQEKRDALISLADRFDASVGQLVGLMASGSGELEVTAKSMSSTAEGHQPPRRRGRLGRHRSQPARSDGRGRRRRTLLLHHRDQPSGRAIRRGHRPRRGQRTPHRHHRARPLRWCPANRACRRADLQHRGADQSARAQRHHRGRARR
ncbi:HAMP domain-containing protein [Bradyrhizobium sp. LB7.1]